MVNCFLPNQFDITRAEYKWVCFFLTFYIFGTWVEEIYKSIKEKEDAKKKKESDERIAKKAKIEEGRKTKEGKYRI